MSEDEPEDIPNGVDGGPSREVQLGFGRKLRGFVDSGLWSKRGWEKVVIRYGADLTVELPGEIKSVFILWRSTVLKDTDKVDIPAMVVSDEIKHEKRLAF